ncbi:MAG TPA: hypothetical protein VOA64_18065 [Candidatus Dormibacteraeota bacterium]|nr:hypothetical protein [Candidatus Dormibacteraeota bacterium]
MNVVSKRLRADKTRMVRESGTRFGIYFLVALGVLLSASSAHANDIYVAQNSTGAGNGAGCADARSVAWFNNSTSWGTAANQIGPGTTVHLCNTFTGAAGSTMLTVQGSGTSGNPITIKFESGALLTAPYWAGAGGGAINMANQGYIVIDGGTPCGTSGTCNGVIQDTGNGTGLTYQLASYGIEGSKCNNCEYKNLGIYNIYVHTGLGNEIDQTSMQAIHVANSANVTIDNCTFHDIGWAVGGIVENYDIYNNYVYNFDHGIAYGVASGSHGTVAIHNNHFGSMTAWDNTANSYHHDSIHIWGGQPAGTISGVWIYNNLFDGDPGRNVNAYVFLEQAVSNAVVFNNVMISPSNRTFPTEICLGNKGSSISQNNQAFNNTILGGSYAAGTALQNSLQSGTIGPAAINNIIQGQNVVINYGNSADTSTTPCSSPGGSVTGCILSNMYEDVAAAGGSYNAFGFHGTNGTTLAWWRAALPAGTGQDAGAQLMLAAAMKLDSTGHPMSGSPVIGTGTNLTSLCTGPLVPLCKDKDGNSRPASGVWDVGAYNSGVSGRGPAAPSGLNAIVN